MDQPDLILNGLHTPTLEEIMNYMDESARGLWQDFQTFAQGRYQVTPKTAYSKCSAKPGWNVKYQKSGKSLCTLYPEPDGFVVLVVVKLDLVPMIKAMADEFEPVINELVKSANPFNGTLWLMIPVNNHTVLNNVKQLLLLKSAVHKQQRAR